MKFHKNFIIRGIATAAAVVTVLTGCNALQGQDKAAELQNFVGNWKFISAKRGDKTETPSGGMQLERSDERIIGVVLPVGFLELKPAGQGKLEGSLWLFGAGEKPIRVPATAELVANKKELNVAIMTSKVDKTSLPSQLQQEFSQDFTFVAQQITEPPLDLGEQTNQARNAEARQNMGALNRGEQAYFLEQNKFTSSLPDLGVGIKPETENYSYSLNLIDTTGAQTIAIPKIDGLKSYTGGVFAIKNENNETLTIAIVCESEQPSKTPPAPPQLVGKEIQCPAGFRNLSK